MTFELRQTEFSDRFAPSLLTKLAALRAPVIFSWWQRRETEEALQWLSDRDLADIGVARHEIREVARSQAPTFAMRAKRRAR
ncbi:hypothetical protein B5K05_25445 [Rhizobium phaseoli]|uniref:DUF1127 domain-containing protein n=1 Tax=Rhizobium phaseoli TaxID=396 RepID=UPI0003630A5B|nr:DUF1127 domain-containing protein [Rhizobium phaseoli]KKZ83403.1 hypothetical protein RPHASCH2410_PD00555 [Rhizobium phaseoli Ch24-10]RDJ04085.1 hypothetical protein B5K04_25375 [Rhizobium phaseoli]RDJ05936.1 hypothetical protein B5K05_25445 [Rhizobium phaseoli]